MKRERKPARTGRAQSLAYAPEIELSLRPLRDIGRTVKSAHWEFEDVQAALRVAHRIGVAPERLFAAPDEAGATAQRRAS